MIPPAKNWLSSLSFDIGLEVESTYDTHIALGLMDDDTRTELIPQLDVEMTAELGKLGGVLVALEFAPEIVLTAPADTEMGVGLLMPRVKEMFVLLQDIFASAWTFRIGRQDSEDTRHWLFDDEVDALRATYRTSRFALDLVIAQESLSATDLRQWRITDPPDYYWFYGQYHFGQSRQLAVYSLIQKDRQENTQLFFFGLQSWGKLASSLSYWLDFAHVRGREEGQQVQGWGGDISLLYTANLPWQPAVMLGFALGSGDQGGEEGRDTAFRQTGLEGNNAELTSDVDIQYYGELFDPELSNMLIVTTGAGLRPLPKLALTLLYHDYHQHRAAAVLRDARITAEPTGRSRALGGELDFIGSWILNKVELKLVLAAFWPGSAFAGAKDLAFFAQARVRIEFD